MLTLVSMFSNDVGLSTCEINSRKDKDNEHRESGRTEKHIITTWVSA